MIDLNFHWGASKNKVTIKFKVTINTKQLRSRIALLRLKLKVFMLELMLFLVSFEYALQL